MKYFLVEITTVNGATAKALWEHETLAAAKSQYHSGLASAYANPDLSYALYMVLNEKGFSEVMETIGTEEPND